MARRRAEGPERKLLDSWEPPDQAGEPVGCLATTYTFKPDFFEEHCVSRFLRLEMDPREDGAAYLIEREERLAQAKVCVLVDRAQADGAASPRWGVLPVSVPTGIQHAKVSLLCWSRLVRLIVGSPNLTDSAYRQNQEIFGVLDFPDDGGEAPAAVLEEALAFLEVLLGWAPGDPRQPGPKARALTLLQWTRERVAAWPPATGRGDVRVLPLFLAPAPPYADPVPGRLGRIVRDRGGPAHSGWVLSPFFDVGSDQPYPPTVAMIEALTERGERAVEFGVPAETTPDGRLRLRAPRSLIRPGRKRAGLTVRPVSAQIDRDTRPLHAKAIWCWSDRWHAYMIGSSNFTTAGLGLEPGRTNAEANLVYVAPEGAAAVRALEASWPPWDDPVGDPDAAVWDPQDEVDEDGGAGAAPLPAGFREATYVPRGEHGSLRLELAEPLPAAWTAVAPAGGTSGEPVVVCGRAQWETAGRPGTMDIPWPHRSVPTRLEVTWSTGAGEERRGTWPVNVSDPAALPPPDELRHLPLETLIEILVSTAPLHEAIARALARGTRGGGAGDAAELDPHQRVRTETFLLQRTRRVSAAIERMLERLQRPVFTEDALAWRFQGPLGPRELARAIRTEARSAGEECFLLTEILLALARLEPGPMAAGVPVERVAQELAAVRGELRDAIRQALEARDVPGGLVAYVGQALEEAGV
jgi:hypothetical protein